MSTKYNLKKILIIRLSSIGDVILTSHLSRLLKNKETENERLEIYLLTASGIAPLFQNEKNYCDILQYDGSNIAQLKQDIKQINFDIVLDLQKNSISKKILEDYEGDLRKVDKYRRQKLEMVYLKKFPDKVIHVAERYMDTCRDLIIDDGKGLQLAIGTPKSDEQNDSKIIGIAPEAFHKTKRWPQERFAKLIDLLIKDSYEVRIFGIDGATLSTANPKAINFSGKLSLVETTEKISECDYFISNDTGLMHIASAFQIPIVVIFGSSVQELGFTPFRVTYEIVENDIWCRPCSHIGRSFCPLGHFKCMNEISVEMVYERFGEMVRKFDTN